MEPKLSGPSFDHRFALDVARAYEEVIATIEASRADIRDEVLVVLLDTSEPTMRKHQLMAEDIVYGNVSRCSTSSGPGSHSTRPY